MTLTQLRREITHEELYLWITYFGLVKDMEQEAMEKAKKRRR